MICELKVLHYGNNLDVLRRHAEDGSLGLVDLDLPFNSDATYDVVFGGHGETANRGTGYPHVTGSNITQGSAQRPRIGEAEAMPLSCPDLMCE